MRQLKRLDSEIKQLVGEKFFSGEKQRLEESEYEEFVQPIERSIELDTWHKQLDTLIEETREHDAGIDQFAAPRIRETLELTKREAGDAGIWRYLGVVERPDFVRHRWKDCSNGKHFWGVNTRPEANAYARLWWIAELTREDGDYSRTEKALRSQPVANALFKINLSNYKPAAWAFIDVLVESNASAEDVIKPVRSQFTRIPVEQLSYEELVEHVRNIERRVVNAQDRAQEQVL